MTSRHHYHAKRKSTMMSSNKHTAKRRLEFPLHALPEKNKKCILRTGTKSLLFINQDIIYNIVSRLTLKDAVRTSLVSSTWRQLWTSYPNLCFDSPTMLNLKIGSGSKRTRHRFIRRVNAFLESHAGIGLRTFQVAFALDNKHAKYLDRWFRFALASKATEITLNMLPEIDRGSTQSWKGAYTLPFHMFDRQSASRIESFQLVFMSLKLPHDFYGFNSLRVLDLQRVHISGDLGLLLSKCNALESLSLYRCFPLQNLKVQQPLHQLRYLSFRECFQESLEFDAANLAKFEYSGRAPMDITLGEPINLKEATITLLEYDDTLEQVFTELPKSMSSVETLFVNTHLKTQRVDISGFFGLRGQLELVWYILDNALTLRSMSIDPRVRAYHRAIGYFEGLDLDIKNGRKCAFKFIPQYDYPNVQIEIF
uniref:F-box domain-containing protein n=1 Tax=Oryza meridionalis TaxID=40149 RepID=A0A0E0CBL4_9ORYZ